MLQFFSSIAFMLAAANVPSAGDLQGLLDILREHSTSQQYAVFADAIQASPELKAQLEEIASQGLVKSFSITTIAPTGPKHILFGAKRDGTQWLFTPEFIEQQAKKRLYDVVRPDDRLPNNMVFALGHLAFHAHNAAMRDAELKPLLATGRQLAQAAKNGAPVDLTNYLKSTNEVLLRDEAGAFIQGWNDVVDAAEHERTQTPFTIAQMPVMLLNLRYRAPLMQAMNAHDHAVKIEKDGRLDPSPANLDAIAAALGSLKVSDLE
jgi:hypothetical protein